MMFEDDIERLLSYSDATTKMYRGVRALDEATLLKEPGFYICNTDRRSQPGTHWILYMRTKNDNHIYFDSFGLPPVESELQKLVVDEYNSKCLQSLYSPFCGMYCAFFASRLCRGYTLQECVSLFSDNLVRNDLTIIKLVEDEFVA